MLLTGCHFAPTAISSTAVAIIGDSYTGGSPSGGRGEHGWPAIVAVRLGRQGLGINPAVGSEGGSGYVHRGNHKHRVFADQIREVVRPDDRLVLIFGSPNDSRVAPDELSTGVHHTLGDVRATAPKAKLLIIGPAYVNPPDSGMLGARDVVKAEAESMGATFIDPFAEQWFIGRSDLIGADRSHPNDAGHVYLADKISPLIAQQLQQLTKSP